MWEHSERNKARHASALAWMEHLAMPYALAWLDRSLSSDATTTRLAVRTLFDREGFPADSTEDDLLLRHDPLGKPYIEWRGAVMEWASRCGRDCRHLHISNTHDGDAHLILGAYEPGLVGLGIDMVYLPRLRAPGKDADYLRRFASNFMGADELDAFTMAAAQDDEEMLRRRVAAHFALMEAASKALGTGLKIGLGMGKSTSLPKQAMGVRTLEPGVELLPDTRALQRMEALGAHRMEAYWGVDEQFLVSAVLLWNH